MTTRSPVIERVAMPTHRGATGRRAAARSLVLAAPVIVYFAVRPSVHSDAAGLAIAGTVPLVYNLGLILWRRRIDLLAVLTSLGFASGCLGSLLAGGSSLPLKLHEAAVTFILGVILNAAVLLRRPLPLGRYLKIPHAGRQLDATLSVIVGGFLMLHALLHLALAVTLSTATYLTLGRVVNLATIGIGAACHVRLPASSTPLATARGHRSPGAGRAGERLMLGGHGYLLILIVAALTLARVV